MPKENKQSRREGFGHFLIATFCALVFIALWCIKLFSAMLWRQIIALVAFGSPILLLVGIVGIVCSVYVIKKRPSLEAWGYCYLIIFALSFASFINGMMRFAGSGP
jgi:uncharacterized membrane protein HdeD (DUF308 family)